MLTEKQKEALGECKKLIDQFIGEKSVFNMHFTACQLLSPSSKIECLEMAIQPATKHFLPFLDTVFALLKSDLKSAHIIIAGIKFINDLYNNTQMKKGTNYLTHYFGELGSIYPELLKKVIVKEIQTKKETITEAVFINLDEPNIISTVRDDSWRSGAMSPPEGLLLGALTVVHPRSGLLKIFSPGAGISAALKPGTKIPEPKPLRQQSQSIGLTINPASTSRIKYNNRFLIDISKQMMASTEHRIETRSLAAPK